VSPRHPAKSRRGDTPPKLRSSFSCVGGIGRKIIIIPASFSGFFLAYFGLSGRRALTLAARRRQPSTSTLRLGGRMPPTLSHSRPIFMRFRYFDFEMSSSEFHLAQNTHCQLSTRVRCKPNVFRDDLVRTSTGLDKPNRMKVTYQMCRARIGAVLRLRVVARHV